jgi:thymidylate synthase
VNAVDVAGDDEDAAALFQYGDTSTFYRVTADGDHIKIERQHTDGTKPSGWKPVETTRTAASPSTFPQAEAARNAEQLKNAARQNEIDVLVTSNKTNRNITTVSNELRDFNEAEIHEILKGWKDNGVFIDGKKIEDIEGLIQQINENNKARDTVGPGWENFPGRPK